LLAITGRVSDSAGKPLAEAFTVEAFEESVLGPRFDRHLGSASLEGGRFAIHVAVSLGVNARKVYLVLPDPAKRFGEVRSGRNEFAPFDSHGRRKWRSEPLDVVEGVDITVSLVERPVPAERYEAVVVGSGFGGSITALTLANKYAEAPGPTNRVCVLERGQWWVSDQVPETAAGTTDGKATIREYLEKHDVPFATWPTPDDLSGFLRVVASSRTVDPVKGVYDYRSMKNVSVLSASGVGGGSLIYFNLTTRPDPATYAGWAIQSENDRPLDKKYSFREVYGDTAAKEWFDDLSSAEYETLDYFDIAENFIGVNKITTTAALGKFKLAKTKVFQEAAEQVDISAGDLMNKGSLDAELSITDVRDGTFGARAPTRAESARLSMQTNVCQREGRCGLGCLPEARHTMSQRIYDAVRDGKPIDVFPLCQVDSIEKNGDDRGFRYTVLLTDYRGDAKGVQRRIEANTVVLAAGTLGSTEILLRSKNLRKSGAVGQRFSTNGDTFGIVSPTKDKVDAGRGPLLTSIARYRDKQTGALEFSLEDLGIPKMFAEVLPPLLWAMTLQKDAGSIVPKTNLSDLFNRHVVSKVTSEKRAGNELVQTLEGLRARSSQMLTEASAKVRDGLRELELDAEKMATPPEERLQNVIVLFGMGRDEPTGRLVADEKGALTLDKPYDLGQEVYGDIVDRMKLFAKEIGRDGESDLTIPFWDERTKLGLTAHPLGGCPMGKDASEGVVDGLGRVYAAESGTSRHDGLFVADGSIIPTSLGVNPSLTICALAFRIAEEISGDRRFWPR
jgi:choline dehydrogenase-like flavoprotein